MSEFFNLSKKNDTTYALTISGTIGSFFDDYFYEGNTLDLTIKNKLAAIPSDINNLEVRINSPGGSMTVGYSIYNQLKSCGKNITTINLGECSSIASLIFLAGSTRIMPNSSYALIHQPWHETTQNLKIAKQNIQQLEAVTNSMRSVYKEYMNLSEDEIDKMMEEETILTADRALEIGFSTSKTLPSGVSVDNVNAETSGEIFAQRVAMTKGFIKNQHDILLSNYKNNEVNLMSDNTKTIDVEALIKEKAIIEGKLEASEKMKADVEAAFKAYKTEHQPVDVEAIKAEARKEAITQLKELEGVKAKAVQAGFKAEGETTEDVMRSVVTEFGMKAESFKDLDAITEMFNYVIKNKPSDDADADYAAFVDKKTEKEDTSKKASSNFFDTLNKKAKGTK